ncbi:hypothetical protein Hanom_Chr06g00494461 [Helianthus anomalus]
MGVLGEFKRGVDVAHGDWFGVREGTHLLGVHPLHPQNEQGLVLFCSYSLSHYFIPFLRLLIYTLYGIEPLTL